VPKVNKKEKILPKGFEVKDLVGISWESLQQLFKQLNGRKITKEELPKWKLMLGFVNSTNNATKTSMQCFRMIDLPATIKYMDKSLKKRKY
jgi:hypothetical protein